MAACIFAESMVGCTIDPDPVLMSLKSTKVALMSMLLGTSAMDEPSNAGYAIPMSSDTPRQGPANMPDKSAGQRASVASSNLNAAWSGIGRR